MSAIHFPELAQRLRARALRLAKAHVAAQRASTPSRWRQAALLWPLFTKG